MRYFDRHRKRLTKHHYIRGTLKSVSGEQEVKIEDSAGVSFNKVEIAGNTSQKQYQGYNPLKFKDFTQSRTDSDGNVITLEMKDGIATINGISNVFVTLSVPYTQLAITNPTFKAGTYTFTPYYYRVQGQGIMAADWGLDGYKFTGATGLATKIFENDFIFGACHLYISPNTEYKDYKFAPAIFEGTYTSLDELPPYEPYVGGIPSPNPGQKIPIYTSTESTIDLTSDLESASITYNSDSLYTIAFEHPFSFNGAESLTLSASYFNTGNICDVLVVGANTGNILNGYGTLDYIAYGDASQSEVTIYSSGYGDTFYIGVGNTDTGISVDNVESYRSLVIGAGLSASGIVKEQTGVREIPAYPQEIENVNTNVVVEIPSEYQQVEYIESDGNCYIDTGIKGSSNVKMQFDGAFETISNYTFFTGSREAVRTKEISFLMDTTFIFRFGTETYSAAGTSTKTNVKISKDGAFINGELKKSFTQTDWSNDYNITIFAVNNLGTIRYGKGHKLDRYSLFENNVLVRYFIPCYRKSDNVIGLYDLVNDEFYTNNGTGEFIKGADVTNVGTNIVLHGDNLLNKEEFAVKALRDETVLKGHGVAALSYTKINTFLKPNTNYVFTFEIEGVTGNPNNEVLRSGQGLYIWNSVQNKAYGFKTTKILNSGEIQKASYKFKTPDDFYEQKFTMWSYSGSYGNWIDATCIIRNVQIVEGTEAKPYQPYFREEIAIPTSVEVEGETVDLLMSKWDKLTVDRLNNKVTYIEGSCKKVFTGEEAWVFHTVQPEYGIPNIWYRLNVSPSGNVNASVNPQNLSVGFGYSNMLLFSFEQNSPNKAIWGFRFQYRNGNRLYIITPPDAELDTIDKFKAFLQEKYANGTPLTIEYVIEPITHDITSTELGQALLRLCVDRGLEGTLRVESELGISSLSCDYYSQENEDKVLLTVSYQNEAGDALMNDKTHNVRRGSKYQIVSPQIDGYEPIEKEVFGIADGDLTIILKYKEVSDVTV